MRPGTTVRGSCVISLVGETDHCVGKPYSVALNEDLAEVSGCLKYYAGYADKIHGQVIDTTPAKLAYTIREPIGVCGQIIPWNCKFSPQAQSVLRLDNVLMTVVLGWQILSPWQRGSWALH